MRNVIELEPEYFVYFKEDQRQDTTKNGIIQECQYCKFPILTDDEDYYILNCNDCTYLAIRDNCL